MVACSDDQGASSSSSFYVSVSFSISSSTSSFDECEGVGFDGSSYACCCRQGGPGGDVLADHFFHVWTSKWEHSGRDMEDNFIGGVEIGGK